MADRVQGDDRLIGTPLDVPLGKGRQSSASDACFDGGIGTPRGMTSEISDRSRSPRWLRKSWTSSAVSLGAGGHLNGVEVTPTTTRPPSKFLQDVTEGKSSGHGVELVAVFE